LRWDGGRVPARTEGCENSAGGGRGPTPRSLRQTPASRSRAVRRQPRMRHGAPPPAPAASGCHSFRAMQVSWRWRGREQVGCRDAVAPGRRQPRTRPWLTQSPHQRTPVWLGGVCEAFHLAWRPPRAAQRHRCCVAQPGHSTAHRWGAARVSAPLGEDAFCLCNTWLTSAAASVVRSASLSSCMALICRRLSSNCSNISDIRTCAVKHRACYSLHPRRRPAVRAHDAP
jgi:hypothetical protein